MSSAESSNHPQKSRIRTSIYLLPNLITATSLLFGFLAIKYSIDGRITDDHQYFVFAAYAILAASICDMLDGSVARLTRTSSAFGVQFDTVSDMVSFGIAPAVLAYSYNLHQSSLGFYVAFVYAVCGALRLARFNVQCELGKGGGNSTGIPIPAAALAIAAFILTLNKLANLQTTEKYSAWVQKFLAFTTEPQFKIIGLLVITFLVGLGMISTFEYWTTKSMSLPKKRPFRFFAMVIIVGALFFNLQFVFSLAILLLAYCIHGPLFWIFTQKDKAHEESEIFHAGHEDNE